MNRLIFGLFFGLLAIMYCSSAVAEDATGNLNYFFGKKKVSDNMGTGSDLDDHNEIGIMLDIGPQNYVNWAIDYFESDGDDSGDTLEIKEICLGMRKYFENDPVMIPFLGAGAAYFSADLKSAKPISDKEIGIWFSGGIVFRLNRQFNLGVLLRWSYADIDGYNVGGLHGGIMAGLHF